MFRPSAGALPQTPPHFLHISPLKSEIFFGLRPKPFQIFFGLRPKPKMFFGLRPKPPPLIYLHGRASRAYFAAYTYIWSARVRCIAPHAAPAHLY